ncbi:MAG: SUMF1/EgtB/PvdO family nonheme iron enzyme [Pseudanabaena sp. Salubria-1]|nr:SUMF1/EgtB/PvdO family nonheme iron enzyme [Pseudanabaena sp. Salubria-1]
MLKTLEKVQIHSALRGGSWNNNDINCRSANRNRNDADNRNNNIGFRVVVF